ncbi:glycerol-3-phosphate 1-O-acyltransferase PlsB, partial [Gammaproteobacteria bacterium]|nr:glycerol-3-phosphate 1-O-acyltransferase PlsB [Gammaproteobacteria bacterium]
FSVELKDFLDLPKKDQSEIMFVPCTVFWGRAITFKKNRINLVSKHWSNPGLAKRLKNLLITWGDIWINIGQPIHLKDVILNHQDSEITERRLARMLRSKIQNQKIATLGPNFEHHDDLLEAICDSPSVQKVLESKQQDSDTVIKRIANSIASDMSYKTIRFLTALLNWFWNRIYEGIELNGIERVSATTSTHTLVYVPCHRSHLDYLILSFLLFHKGFMIPHIAAGDNLNIPILGRILRQGGAFFMKRSFSGDPLYSSIFNEYLFQIYNRGHSVEFFPEGGRSRTGRLLPPKLGLLSMTIASHQKGLQKPLAFVPIYIGYEKIIEGSTYVSEMRGSQKTREKLSDVLINLKLIRQNFGRVRVNIGEVINLDEWLKTQNSPATSIPVDQLAAKIMSSINDAASVNSVNLVALVLLATHRQSLEESSFKRQLELYISLTKTLYSNEKISSDLVNADSVIDRLNNLGLLKTDNEDFGTVYHIDPFTAVLMTWYQNNSIHLFSLASLVANLIVNRRLKLEEKKLLKIIETLLPYIEKELSTHFSAQEIDNTIEFLIENNLIEKEGNAFKPPSRADSRYESLDLLAKILSPTVERMFITLNLIVLGKQNINSIGNESKKIARKITRLYGINSPDFFDSSVFDSFMAELIKRGAVQISEDGVIVGNSLIQNIARHADGVISPQIRQAISQAASPR